MAGKDSLLFGALNGGEEFMLVGFFELLSGLSKLGVSVQLFPQMNPPPNKKKGE